MVSAASSFRVRISPRRLGGLLAVALLATGLGARQAPGDRPPPTSESRLAAAGVATDHAGFDHLLVYDETVNHVDARGVTETRMTVLYKVLTPAGCLGLSALRWGYDPQSAEVDVREVTILREGKRIAVTVADVLDLPAPQDMIYWSDRVKLLQLPRLEVGDGIEVLVHRKGFSYALLDPAAGRTEGGGGGGSDDDDDRFIPPMPGEYFDIVLFQADVPTVEKRYELHLPANKRLHSQIYGRPLYASTSYDAEQNVYAWWGYDLPAAPHELRMPDAPDVVAKVVIATAESWEAKSRWFFGVNESQFASNDEIDAAVARILQEAGVAEGSDEEKAEALLHWVAQEIRYSGQTMGKGEGFTLHPADMIYEQRSGVCKDIAGMLIAMLRAADIPAYGAMTMAGSRIESVPADQFNHCVVARQAADGSFVMYDPTWVPYNHDIWSKLETEQHYLVGTAEGQTLSQIPYSPPEESPLRVRHEAKLAADGTLEGTMRFEGTGAMDSRLRRIVYSTPIDRLDERFAEILTPAFPAIEGVSVKHRATRDFSGDMWIEVVYRAPGFAMTVGNGLELTSPALAALVEDVYLFRAAQTAWGVERDVDILLYYTQLLDIEETIHLPAGFTPADLPASKEVDETYAYFKGHTTAKGDALVIHSKAEVRRRQIPPDGFAGFTAAMKEAKSWSKTSLRMEREVEKKEAGQ